jgi:hypothetical protein
MDVASHAALHVYPVPRCQSMFVQQTAIVDEWWLLVTSQAQSSQFLAIASARSIKPWEHMRKHLASEGAPKSRFARVGPAEQFGACHIS